MKLTLRWHDKKAEIEDSDEEDRDCLWLVASREGELQGVALKLDMEDVESLAGFLEAWMIDREQDHAK